MTYGVKSAWATHLPAEPKWTKPKPKYVKKLQYAYQNHKTKFRVVFALLFALFIAVVVLVPIIVVSLSGIGYDVEVNTSELMTSDDARTTLVGTLMTTPTTGLITFPKLTQTSAPRTSTEVSIYSKTTFVSSRTALPPSTATLKTPSTTILTVLSTTARSTSSTTQESIPTTLSTTPPFNKCSTQNTLCFNGGECIYAPEVRHSPLHYYCSCSIPGSRFGRGTRCELYQHKFECSFKIGFSLNLKKCSGSCYIRAGA